MDTKVTTNLIITSIYRRGVTSTFPGCFMKPTWHKARRQVPRPLSLEGQENESNKPQAANYCMHVLHHPVNIKLTTTHLWSIDTEDWSSLYILTTGQRDIHQYDEHKDIATYCACDDKEVEEPSIRPNNLRLNESETVMWTWGNY